MDLELENKLVVVTGAARGIGASISGAFVSEGARVLLVDRDESVEATSKSLGSDFFVCDLTSPTACDDVASSALGLGGADVLINNAGISLPSPLPDTSDDQWREVMSVNLDVAFRLTRSFWGQLSDKKGSIVNLASFASKRSTLFGNNSSYVASKHAIAGLTRASAYEGALAGIRVNAIAPGVVDTDMIKSVHDEETRTKIKSFIPQDRFAEPEEISDLVLFLASRRASHICGEVVNINGGLCMD